MSRHDLPITKGLDAMPDKTSDKEAAAVPTAEPSPEAALDQIKAALRGLKYGVISIIVQDGVVIQLERTEKIRLRRPAR